MSKNKIKNLKPVIENRQARFNFELTENFEAGISLSGWEVKGIRAGQADMKDSYVMMKKGEAWLIGMNINPCLLYTSPSPRDLYRSRMPSSA